MHSFDAINALSDIPGYCAAALVLCTFAAKSMRTLRKIALASNVTFIAYAIAESLMPVLLLHMALLFLNTFRLFATRQGTLCKEA